MNRLRPLALCLLLLPLPGVAQEAVKPETAKPETAKPEIEEGADLLERGAQMLLRGLLSEMEPALKDMGQAFAELEPALRDLAAMIGDIRNYNAPEMLPNGDIILRRKAPLLPEPPKDGEIDL